ncbi:MAG: DUF3291 domain-containing protein [Halioglobus sp.]
MQHWQLAQINVGTIKYAPEDPRMSGFMDRLDEINALAEASPGFVWRLQSDSGNATDIDVGGEPGFLVNMSVWESTESLFEYVYKSMHREVMVGRRQWFERPAALYQVLWWVPAGHQPTPDEGLERLALLQENGPTAQAFSFKEPFGPPGTADRPDGQAPDPYCAGWD